MHTTDYRLATIVVVTLVTAVCIALATAWLVDTVAAITVQGVFVGLAGAAVLVLGIGTVTAVVTRLEPTRSPEERVLGD